MICRNCGVLLAEGHEKCPRCGAPLMEQEQEANRKRLQDLSLLIRRTESQESDVQTFIQEIRQYAAIQELDEAMLHRLISRIVVGEVKKVDGQKQQEVKIIYNFVGEIPE